MPRSSGCRQEALVLGSLLPLSSRARALLKAERLRSEQDPALEQRLLARAEAALARDRPSGFALRASRFAPSVRRRSLRTVALLAAALAVAGFAAAGVGLWQEREAGPTSPLHAPPPTAQPKAVARGGALPLADSVAPAPIAEEPPPKAPRAKASAAPTTERSRPSSVQQYKLELALLEPARSSIARRDYGGALSAIGAHQREFPGGLLAEEREALRVRALWGMGQTGAAEAAASAFRKRYPRSLLLSWMKSAEPAQP